MSLGSFMHPSHIGRRRKQGGSFPHRSGSVPFSLHHKDVTPPKHQTPQSLSPPIPNMISSYHHISKRASNWCLFSTEPLYRHPSSRLFYSQEVADSAVPRIHKRNPVDKHSHKAFRFGGTFWKWSRYYNLHAC